MVGFADHSRVEISTVGTLEFESDPSAPGGPLSPSRAQPAYALADQHTVRHDGRRNVLITGYRRTGPFQLDRLFMPRDVVSIEDNTNLA